ncbi:hypothetical protein B5S32_g2036 [[Candida] boidinii]|nr:hypothetical protein B5S32_g2036 [[Candida] boidinii]
MSFRYVNKYFGSLSRRPLVASFTSSFQVSSRSYTLLNNNNISNSRNSILKFHNCFSEQRRRYANYQHFDGTRTRSGTALGLLWSSSTTRRYVYIAGGLVVVFIVVHLEKAPVTHRLRFMVNVDGFEKMSSDSSYKSLLQQYSGNILPANHPDTVKVKAVMMKLIRAAENYVDPDTNEKLNLFRNTYSGELPLIDWKIHVIDDVNSTGKETPNAFVLGGGKVFVYKSILPICANDDGLATVLAHELGHQLAHHIGEKISKSIIYSGLSYIFYSVFGSQDIGRILISLGAEMPASREMETEADYIGLMIMSLACYNPEEAETFWGRMMKFEQMQGGSIPEILSTHPRSDKRNKRIHEWLPKAEKLLEVSNCRYKTQFDNFSKYGLF